MTKQKVSIGLRKLADELNLNLSEVRDETQGEFLERVASALIEKLDDLYERDPSRVSSSRFYMQSRADRNLPGLRSEADVE
jgi:hypothetical protein